MTVFLDNSLGKIQSLPQTPEIVVKKTLNSHGKEELEIDGKQVAVSDWLTMLQKGGLMTHSPINFILQGKAKQAANLDEKGVFELYSEIIGTATYSRCRSEIQEILTGTSTDEKKSWEILEDFRESLGELEVYKEEYSKYEDSIKTSNR